MIKLKIVDGEFWYECESLEQEKELDEILDKYDKEDKEKDQRIATLEKEIEFLWSGRFSISCNNDNNWKCMSDSDCSVCVEKQAKKEIEREAGK